MRYFLCCLFILSAAGCDNKVARTSPFRSLDDRAPDDKTVLSKVEGSYSSRAEGVYGLLWPKDLESADPEKLKNVLVSARELQATRKAYTVENARILGATALLKCECATAGICKDGDDPSTFPPATVDQCTLLENEKFKNDEKLSTLIELQEILKKGVLEVGGDWLENDPIDLRIDLMGMEFDLGAIKFTNLEGASIALLPAADKNKGSYDKLGDRMIRRANSIYWEAGQNLANGNMQWELDAIELPGALQFQGKLTLQIDGVERRGQLGFQLPKK